MARKQLGTKASQSSHAVTLGDVGFRGAVCIVDGDVNMVANSETSLPFHGLEMDVGGFTTGATGNDIVKIPNGLGGYYRVNLRLIVDNDVNSGGIAGLIRLNTFLYRELPLAITKGVGAHMVATADIFELSPGDTFSMTYYANTTGMTLRSANGRTTQFMIEKIG